MKNKMFNIFVVILSAGIFISFLIYTKGINHLIDEVKTLNKYWLLAAVALMLIFLVFETLIIYVITKAFCKKEKLLAKSFRYEMIGQFFSAITPFASGSHPAQLYAMMEDDIPAGIGGSILMIKFITHQTVILLYLVIALIFKFNYFNERINYFFYLCIFGVVTHFAVILLAIMFCINKNITKKILNFGIKMLGKIRLVKNPEAAYEKVELELENFHKNAVLIKEHMRMWVDATVLTLLQWLVFFAIPYCLYRSFDFNSVDIVTMIVAQIFLVNFMSIIPLPGAEGGAEGGFYIIYGLFFRSDTVITAILIWRIITYYFAIAVSSIFMLILPHKDLRKIKN